MWIKFGHLPYFLHTLEMKVAYFSHKYKLRAITLNFEVDMKNSLIMAIIAFTIIPSIKSHADETLPLKQFLGTYELVKAVKESPAHGMQRASKCRDTLMVFMDENEADLILRGEDANQAGLTINWIENNSNTGIQNVVSEGYIEQKRLWEDRRVLGLKRTIKLVTSIKKEDDVLTYNYKREIYNSLLNRTSHDSEALCIYKKM